MTCFYFTYRAIHLNLNILAYRDNCQSCDLSSFFVVNPFAKHSYWHWYITKQRQASCWKCDEAIDLMGVRWDGFLDASYSCHFQIITCPIHTRHFYYIQYTKDFTINLSNQNRKRFVLVEWTVHLRKFIEAIENSFMMA